MHMHMHMHAAQLVVGCMCAKPGEHRSVDAHPGIHMCKQQAANTGPAAGSLDEMGQLLKSCAAAFEA